MAITRHHLWYPRKDYKGATEKKFRNLPCNIIYLDEIVHRLIHQHHRLPIKPGLEEMHRVILRHAKGECNCRR